jgi:hypothetical protein
VRVLFHIQGVAVGADMAGFQFLRAMVLEGEEAFFCLGLRSACMGDGGHIGRFLVSGFLLMTLACGGIAIIMCDTDVQEGASKVCIYQFHPCHSNCEWDKTF